MHTHVLHSDMRIHMWM